MDKKEAKKLSRLLGTGGINNAGSGFTETGTFYMSDDTNTTNWTTPTGYVARIESIALTYEMTGAGLHFDVDFSLGSLKVVDVNSTFQYGDWVVISDYLKGKYVDSIVLNNNYYLAMEYTLIKIT